MYDKPTINFTKSYKPLSYSSGVNAPIANSGLQMLNFLVYTNSPAFQISVLYQTTAFVSLQLDIWFTRQK